MSVTLAAVTSTNADADSDATILPDVGTDVTAAAAADVAATATAAAASAATATFVRLSTLPAGEDAAKIGAELVRGVVVDERIDAGVAVYHADEDDAKDVVEEGRGRLAVVCYERVDVVRQPRYAEDDHFGQ